MARAVGQFDAVKWKAPAVTALHLAETDCCVECNHRAGVRCTHGMILEMGSSRIPVAPASFNSGMSVLICVLETTVSTA